MSERIERALCFCGKIQAEARGEPFWVCSDHDDDCRRAIGSPSMSGSAIAQNRYRSTAGCRRRFRVRPA